MSYSVKKIGTKYQLLEEKIVSLQFSFVHKVQRKGIWKIKMKK